VVLLEVRINRQWIKAIGIYEIITFISAMRTSSLENTNIDVTYSGVTLMSRIIEKGIAAAISLDPGVGSEYSSDRREHG
jgi:hypothetical protein